MKSKLCCLLLICFFGIPAHAVEDSGQDAEVISGEAEPAENAGDTTPDIAQTQDNLQQLLSDVEKRYGEIAVTLRSLQQQIDTNRHNIDKIELSILASQRAIAKERKELAGQVKAAYEMGQQEQLKLLLNQQDPALSNRMMIYYSYINKARMAKIAQLEHSISELERLDQEKQSETRSLEQHLQAKKTQQTALNQVRQQRKSLLADTLATSHEEQLRLFTENENKLRNLIASLPQELGIVAGSVMSHVPETDEANQANGQEAEKYAGLQGNFDDLKGKLLWPVQGRLVKSFNNLQTGGAQSGVLIEAKEGVDVHAVAAGKVTFADWMRGYGYLVIIDHGGGYMTLYAFNQNLATEVNKIVKPGEIIATVGQSGGRSHPGLYFGIRKQAAPIDPLLWCRSY
jgi:septal ring factor EnvC (AmiA/AmiB activator)